MRVWFWSPGERVHPVHGAADPRALHLDGEEEVPALPGAPSRPLQAQDADALHAAGQVGGAPLCLHKKKKERLE